VRGRGERITVAAVAVKSDPSSWSDPRHLVGLAGERVAIRYLRGTGWTVLDHRFRMGRLEVDVVARRGALVAFIEVKTRLGPQFGSPLQAVTWSKRREIIRVASAWVERHGRPDDAYRFDVIGVTVTGRGHPVVQHVADAFRVGWR
jgi:putative endonuclease